MKTKAFTFIVVIFILAFLGSMPLDVHSATSSRTAPPVEQTLIREGDFAVQLINILGISKTTDEMQAISVLTSYSILPRNGWVADYPMTPDIIVEIQDAVMAAVDAGRIALPREKALRLTQDLCAKLGLPVMGNSSEAYAQYGEQTGYSEYNSPTVIENYYYNYGPPIVTYYAPPWDYYYLYSWVPFPFWWGGWAFRGFYVLNRFYRPIIVPRPFPVPVPVPYRPRILSSHFKNKSTGRFQRVNHRTNIPHPNPRALNGNVKNGRGKTPTNVLANNRGASSIYNRSMRNIGSARPRSYSGRSYRSTRGANRYLGTRSANRNLTGRHRSATRTRSSLSSSRGIPSRRTTLSTGRVKSTGSGRTTAQLSRRSSRQTKSYRTPRQSSGRAASPSYGRSGRTGFRSSPGGFSRGGFGGSFRGGFGGGMRGGFRGASRGAGGGCRGRC